VDGLTGQPITGSGTVSYKNGATAALANGVAQLQDVARGDKVTISGVDGYRVRNTLYCGDDKVMLWLNRPGDVDEALTQAIGYTMNGVMKRPDAVYLLPSAEIQADAQAMAMLRQAATRVMAAVEGRTPISVVTSNPGQGAVFDVRINPAITFVAQTGFNSSADGKITGGLTEFRSIVFARNAVDTVHEVTRTLGINGVNPYPGIMNIAGNANDFTPQELKVLRLRYTRPLNAVFAGDNDQVVGCH
jgi:hypothetical protein